MGAAQRCAMGDSAIDDRIRWQIEPVTCKGIATMRFASATCALIALLLPAAPALAAEAAKRLIDRWTGIVFYCASDFEQGWTMDACAEIATDVVAQGEAAGVKVAILEMTGEPQWMAVSAKAGFDGSNAVSMLFAFTGSDKPDGFTTLDLTMQVPLDPKPGVSPEQWATLFTQTTTIDPGEHTDVSVDAAATVFSGILEFLTKPQ